MPAAQLPLGDAVLLLRAVWATLKNELAREDAHADDCMRRMIHDMDTGFDLLSDVVRDKLPRQAG